MFVDFVRKHCFAIIMVIVVAPFVILGMMFTDLHFSRSYRLQQRLQENVEARARAAKAHTPPKISLVGWSEEQIKERYDVDRDGNVLIHGTPYVFHANEEALLRVDDAY